MSDPHRRIERSRTQWLKDSAFFWLGGAILFTASISRLVTDSEATRRGFLYGVAAGLLAAALLGLLALRVSNLRLPVVGLGGLGVCVGTIAAHTSAWDESLFFGFMGTLGLVIFTGFVIYMILRWDQFGLPPAR
jgi:hypothetical protein